jgi:glycerol-3-phosphate dehydrogenase
VTPPIYDIAIVGGGVNGCGIARDAAGRGLSVLLVEQNDLASGTSSASTKLIHGGLRYLEYYEFRLVRESLMEREVLWGMAPHIIWPLRFVLPHHKALRPAWLIRLGLFLYDHLGGRKLLPPTRTVDLSSDPTGVPLKPGFKRGFEYSDCWVDDARLVVLNAMDAAAHGADVRTRTACDGAERDGDAWQLTLRDTVSGTRETARARTLVNAAGPWIATVMDRSAVAVTGAEIRLVKGSHIVVPRLYDHDRAYIFQNADQRIIFAIPYAGDYTLIGTTDVDISGDPGAVTISQDEIDYLCASASEYFRATVDPDTVVWSYSGVRPLFDDGSSAAQEATRDYVLDLQAPAGEPAVLNIFGGKITTYRRLAEEALDTLKNQFPGMKAAWTRGVTLPGGDFPADGFGKLVADLQTAYPGIGGALIARLARAYGTRARDVLGDARTTADLGTDFGAGLTQREVEYLVTREWARTADDIVWRRSKLGLRMSADDIAALQAWLEQRNSRANDEEREAAEQPAEPATPATDSPPAPAE